MPKVRGAHLNEDIKYYANKLAELLVDSEEFRSYSIARDNLQKDRNYSYLLADCRQRQLQLHLATLAGEDVADDEREFENVYADLTKEPVVSDFLFAEARFYSFLTQVQQILGKDLELWSEGEALSPVVDQMLN